MRAILRLFAAFKIYWHKQEPYCSGYKLVLLLYFCKHKRGSEYSDFWPIERYISETVQDRS